MKNRTRLLMLTMLMVSCTKPYTPPQINSPASYLVVEGTVNTTGITTILLSKTVGLPHAGATNPANGAVPAIQGNQGANYPLTGVSEGCYQSAGLTLDNGQQYRLSIKTTDGQQYYSDFETPAVSPPIDSIGYNITGSGLLFNAAMPPKVIPQVQLFLVPIGSPQIPLEEIVKSGGPIGYSATSRECTDCTIRGTTAAPAFWPQQH